ncbi:MAG: N-acetylmuramoyl-L-alanine amidase, partial [Terrabacter sp.]
MIPNSTPHRSAAPRRVRRSLASLGAVAAVAAGMAMTSPAAQAADPSVNVGNDVGSRERAFAAAASEFGVPRTVLEAVSYAQTRWDFNPGHSSSGGYGPMHLVDADLGSAAEGKGLGDAPAADAPAPVADTLGRAAGLTGLDENALRTDELANIRGGAALLAASQQRLGLPTGTDTQAGDWYAAVADASGSAQEDVAAAFADDTYSVIASGASRHTVDGKDVSLLPSAAAPQKGQIGRLGLAKKKVNTSQTDCPPGLECDWVPAPYAKTGPGAGDYGNHDLASRPASPKITNIVIHNTEASYDTTLKLVTDPDYLAWNYSLRSSDGHIAQHLEPKDVGWHAGNWYVNSHSIGLEHEGFAATGAQWFSEPMYRSSARLVRYLATKYDIPLDMQHIFGHDQIPGVTPNNVAGMHWDPGPYWNWERYFQLLGAPLQSHGVDGAKDLVRILPGFDRNVQTVTSCTTAGRPCEPQGTNFVYLHQAPSETAPLVNDIGRKPNGAASTTSVSDIGARAQAGLTFAVAERQGDWTAIWFNGVKGWFHNPASDPTAIAVGGQYVVP